MTGTILSVFELALTLCSDLDSTILHLAFSYWELTLQLLEWLMNRMLALYASFSVGAQLVLNVMLHVLNLLNESFAAAFNMIPPACREISKLYRALALFLSTNFTSILSILTSWFRRCFDFLHFHLCDDDLTEETKTTFWPSFSCPSSPRVSPENQRECVFRIASVVVAPVFVIVFVAILSTFRRGRGERDLGVDRGTNTPRSDDDREVAPEQEEEGEEEVLMRSPQIKELRDQLVRVTRLLDARGGHEEDKDIKIEELTFENRALRQNAIDEKELQTCIVCREEPRRIVLFPCRHLCLCENCHNHHHFSTCPYCRTRCFRAEKIFV